MLRGRWGHRLLVPGATSKLRLLAACRRSLEAILIYSLTGFVIEEPLSAFLALVKPDARYPNSSVPGLHRKAPDFLDNASASAKRTVGPVWFHGIFL